MPGWMFAATGGVELSEKLNADFNGDWLLALAAYNCGEGRVQREPTATAAKAYPPISVVAQRTREYVPRLLAFKELTRNAKRHGLP